MLLLLLIPVMALSLLLLLRNFYYNYYNWVLTFTATTTTTSSPSFQLTTYVRPKSSWTAVWECRWAKAEQAWLRTWAVISWTSTTRPRRPAVSFTSWLIVFCRGKIEIDIILRLVDQSSIRQSESYDLLLENNFPMGIFWNIFEYFWILWNIPKYSRILWNIPDHCYSILFYSIPEYSRMLQNILKYSKI